MNASDLLKSMITGSTTQRVKQPKKFWWEENDGEYTISHNYIESYQEEDTMNKQDTKKLSSMTINLNTGWVGRQIDSTVPVLQDQIDVGSIYDLTTKQIKDALENGLGHVMTLVSKDKLRYVADSHIDLEWATDFIELCDDAPFYKKVTDFSKPKEIYPASNLLFMNIKKPLCNIVLFKKEECYWYAYVTRYNDTDPYDRSISEKTIALVNKISKQTNSTPLLYIPYTTLSNFYKKVEGGVYFSENNGNIIISLKDNGGVYIPCVTPDFIQRNLKSLFKFKKDGKSYKLVTEKKGGENV